MSAVTLCVSRLVGQTPPAPDGAGGTNGFDGLHSLSLRASAASRDGHRAILELVIDDRGRFAYRMFTSSDPRGGEAWRDRPEYFVFFDGRAVISARPPGTSYVAVQAGPGWLRPLGPPQHLFAPWPVLRAALGEQSLIPGGTVTVWDDAEAALRVSTTKGADGVSFAWTARSGEHSIVREVRFDDFRLLSGYRLPWQVRDRTTRTGASSGVTAPSEEAVYVVEDMQVNPSNLEQRLKFDAIAMAVNRYDQATGDVFSPTGELLYNEKEWNERLLAQSDRYGLLRRWGLPAVVPAAFVSLWFGYRRWRAKRAA